MSVEESTPLITTHLCFSVYIVLPKAPEILEGQGVGPETDIWAIGVLTFIMWAFFPPWNMNTISATYTYHNTLLISLSSLVAESTCFTKLYWLHYCLLPVAHLSSIRLSADSPFQAELGWEQDRNIKKGKIQFGHCYPGLSEGALSFMKSSLNNKSWWAAIHLVYSLFKGLLFSARPDSSVCVWRWTTALCDAPPSQGPAHRSRVSAESLAESTSGFAPRPPLQSVFLHGKAEGVPQAKGGETRPGPHEAPAPLPAVAQRRRAAKNVLLQPKRNFQTLRFLDILMRLNEYKSLLIY